MLSTRVTSISTSPSPGSPLLSSRVSSRKFGIESTPSFVINGKKVGNLDYEEFVDVLEKAAK